MAYYEEAFSKGIADERKKRKRAKEQLKNFFHQRGNKPITLSKAYAMNVSIYPNNKDKIAHWAFYETIEKMIKKGKLVKEPITQIVDYNLTYTGGKRK
jgi:DUF917 family protein